MFHSYRQKQLHHLEQMKASGISGNLLNGGRKRSLLKDVGEKTRNERIQAESTNYKTSQRITDKERKAWRVF